MTRQKTNVLIVEDHGDTAAVCCRLLRRHGYVASSVKTVDELCSRAATETFDIFVCDIQLSGRSGLEVPRIFPSIPALAVTALGSELDVKACMEAGFCEHLLKPFTVDALIAAIERCGAANSILR